MRFVKNLLCVSPIALLAVASNLQAQAPLINGPTLGFTPDKNGTAISVILGVPGASLLGGRLPLSTEIIGPVISARQDYAVALRAADAQAVLIDLTSSEPQISSISGTTFGSEVIGLSPSGSAAAIFNGVSNAIQVIGQLPKASQVLWTFDAALLQGHPTAMSLSDDASALLVKTLDCDTPKLFVVNSSGNFLRLAIDRPGASAFIPNSRNAVVTDDASRSALLIMDASGAATPVPLISGIDGMEILSSIAASDDGARVFLADAKSGNIAIVDVQTRTSKVVQCFCEPKGFYRLKGNSVYRLSGASREPMMVLDASSEPRIVIIPPSAPAVSEAQ